MLNLIRQTLTTFCCEFTRNPYLCYTEHGQHALFFSMLLSAIPDSSRFLEWQGQKVCIVQKEYPTAKNLGKPQRQHWDIAVLKSPFSSKAEGRKGFDFLRLEAVIEFGMNEAQDHFEDDLNRIVHSDANTEYGFLVHLYRFSDAKLPFSGRDWSPASHRFIDKEKIQDLIKGKPVEAFYAIADNTGTLAGGAWLIPPTGPIQNLACD